MKTVELIDDKKYTSNELSAMNEVLTEFSLHQILKVLAVGQDTGEGGFDRPLDKWDRPLKPVIEMAYEEGLLDIDDWEEGQEYIMTDEGKEIYREFQDKIKSFKGVIDDHNQLRNLQEKSIVEFFRARYYGGCAESEFDDLERLGFEGLPGTWQKIIISDAFMQYLLHQEDVQAEPREEREAFAHDSSLTDEVEEDAWEEEEETAEERAHLETRTFRWRWPIFWFALFSFVLGYFLWKHPKNIFLMIPTGVSGYFLAHFLFRKLTVGPEGMELRTLFGVRRIAWNNLQQMSEDTEESYSGSIGRSVHINSVDGEEIAVSDWMYDYRQFLAILQNNMG